MDFSFWLPTVTSGILPASLTRRDVFTMLWLRCLVSSNSYHPPLRLAIVG
jgi:hypothetical protein